MVMVNPSRVVVLLHMSRTLIVNGICVIKQCTYGSREKDYTKLAIEKPNSCSILAYFAVHSLAVFSAFCLLFLNWVATEVSNGSFRFALDNSTINDSPIVLSCN